MLLLPWEQMQIYTCMNKQPVYEARASQVNHLLPEWLVSFSLPKALIKNKNYFSPSAKEKTTVANISMMSSFLRVTCTTYFLPIKVTINNIILISLDKNIFKMPSNNFYFLFEILRDFNSCKILWIDGDGGKEWYLIYRTDVILTTSLKASFMLPGPFCLLLFEFYYAY